MTGFSQAIARIATVATVLVFGGGEAARADGAEAARVDVEVGERACMPDELTVQAGDVTFLIHNATSRALEWEILDGVMVVDERENIGVGRVESLTTRLAPGDYQITCGFPTNPKGQLHVAALPGARARINQTDLIGPLAEYRVYVSYEIDGLVDDTRRLADALKTGDLALAREAFQSARAHYARVTPIAMFFPDLDGDVETRSEGGGAADDPTYMGFRQLEWDLFDRADARDGARIAEKLAADAVAMQSQFEILPLTLKPTWLGVSGAIGGAAPALIEGESNRQNAIALTDLSADIEGARKIVDLFRPVISRADGALSGALASDFAALAAGLAKYQTADGAFGPTQLSADDRAAMRSVTKRLTGEVARIPAVLGVD